MSQSTAELAREFFEIVWNQKLEDAMEQLAHPDGVSHQVFGDVIGFNAFRDNIYRPFINALPDLHIEIEDVVADGDQAVVRWRATGTHLGDGLGMPPSGRQVKFAGMTWLAFRDGKLAEGWDGWDPGDLLHRLAAFPEEPDP